MEMTTKMRRVVRLSLSEQQVKQPIFTFGAMGSGGVGKTSMIKSLTGINTMNDSRELVNNSTRKTGYVNLRIYLDGRTNEYITNPEEVTDDMVLMRHYSMIDNPGQNEHMFTFLTGIYSLDCVLFVVQFSGGITSQTVEHLKCFKMLEHNNMNIVITKIDQAPTPDAVETCVNDIYNKIDECGVEIDGDTPIVPISNVNGDNVDELVKCLVHGASGPRAIDNVNNSFYMPIIRSFSVEKNVANDEQRGGVLGGVIMGGYLEVNDIVCVLPGHMKNDYHVPLITRVKRIMTGDSEIDLAIPGGTVAFETTLHSNISKANRLVGQILVKLEDNDMTKIFARHKVTRSFVVTHSNIEFVDNKTYYYSVHGSTYAAVFVNNVFESVVPNVFSEGETVVILDGGCVITSGKISVAQSASSRCQYQSDAVSFLGSVEFNEPKEIQIDNDLRTIEYRNDFLDIINRTNFATVQRRAVNIPPMHQNTTETTFGASNMLGIYGEFITGNDALRNQIIMEFSKVAKEKIPKLSRAEARIEGDGLIFRGLRNARSSRNRLDMERISINFMCDKFKCKACNMEGSVVVNGNSGQCVSCGATTNW